MASPQRIFVGDVQGCADELAELLERARGEFGDGCELWFVGDLVNRGPKNLEVLRLVRDLVDGGRGQMVLGNHEIGLLRCALGERAPRPLDSIGDVLSAPDLDDWIEWLRRRPLLATSQLGRQPFAMVHAATHPDWDLATLERNARVAEKRLGARDLREARALLGASPAGDDASDLLARLTHCRSVSPAGNWSPEEPAADRQAWHRAWSRREHTYGVVYGHWSMQGLHVAPGLRGLDTGCVHHGRGRDGALTAWLPDPDSETPFATPDDRFWSVPARSAYYGDRRHAVGL